MDHGSLVRDRRVKAAVECPLCEPVQFAHMLERVLAVDDVTDVPDRDHFAAPGSHFGFSYQPCLTRQKSLPSAASRPHP